MKTKIITVKVTKKDIEQGKQYHECNCPVARAVKRRLRIKHCWVFDGKIVWGIYPSECAQPRRVQQFIQRFDEKDRTACKPFSFRLTVPVARLIIRAIHDTTS